ncbi:hypothetical protein M409DRAFT_15750 [Zasmidium cellare ATCC 36951]|uniref:Uncharacterized protein n=1 Tax=Zasmidium cellare ATCC 36951 TaxID=1080233 RepID=A0A6A6D5Q0_ZASCE|nr:uncharacterized protein M409DRAFT_15750 [Zasmidium cellare ATCC 36951]KAF2173469.1 hypothetical protein M409DRAFT_15750 [Zasmidium cellare ATCC 36951]
MNTRGAWEFLWTAFSLLCLQTTAAELSPTGTGSAYASRCNAAKQDWQKSQGRTFVSETTYNSTFTGLGQSTSITTKTFLSDDAAPFTLCDGYPRINGSRTILTVTTTTPFTSTIETSSSVYSSFPPPRCIIESDDCARLRSDLSRSLDVFTSLNAEGNPTMAYPSSPICGPATLIPVTASLGKPACAMQEASVRLLYWPVTVASTCDSCQRATCPTTTLGPTISGQPNTFKTLNTTLTSPTVYIEFVGSWAYTSQGTTFSTPQTLIVAQEADAVSSHCGKPGGGYGPPRKVNYADFNEPVPADVYRCQPSCYVEPMPFTYTDVTHTYTYDLGSTTLTKTPIEQSYISEAASNLCSTIWNDYAPVLMIPEAFKTINPAGFQEPGSIYGDDNPCNFIFNEDAVLFDPPLALTEASEAAKPTLPHANSAYTTPTDADPTAIAATTSEPTVAALPESLGLTLPSNGPVATVYTDPKPTEHSSQAIGDVIASVLGMTSKGNSNNSPLTLAMAPDGSALIVNGVTTTVSGADSEATGMITVAGNTMGYTSADGTLIIGDQTLTRGGSVTLRGKSSSSPVITHQQGTVVRPQTAATTSGVSILPANLWRGLAFVVMAVFLMVL